MIAWDDALTVGIAEIDSQHKSIIALINDLEALKGQGDDIAAAKALQFLRSYLHDHFEMEAELMLDLVYPGRAAHQQQHEQFVNHVIFFEIEKEFGVVSEQMLSDILAFLTEWFLTHITQEDRLLGAFARAQTHPG